MAFWSINGGTGADGAVVPGWFVLGLLTGHSFDRTGEVRAGESDVREVPNPA
jgi:hypothetical protein